MSEFVPVAEAGSLAAGQGRSVQTRGRTLALYNVEGSFYAVDDACPHVGGPLGAGFCEGEKLYCPLHGWAFNVKTGQCLTNPHRPLKTYRTRVVNGWVEVEI